MKWTRDKVLAALLAVAVILWGIRERTWSHTVANEQAKATASETAKFEAVSKATDLEKQLASKTRELSEAKAQASASRNIKSRTETKADGSKVEEYEEQQLEEHILSMSRDFEQIQFELEAKREAETVLRQEAERKYEAERDARIDAEAKASKTPWGSLGLGVLIGAGASYGVYTLTR